MGNREKLHGSSNLGDYGYKAKERNEEPRVEREGVEYEHVRN